MSRDGYAELPFGGDVYPFRIAWGELEQLQESRDCGPYVLLDRLLTGRWVVQDISEVLRVGLVGAGMDPVRARKMVDEHVRSKPPVHHLVIAQKVLGAGVVGAPEEEVGKKSEAASQETDSPSSQTESSDLPPSTETAP